VLKIKDQLSGSHCQEVFEDAQNPPYTPVATPYQETAVQSPTPGGENGAGGGEDLTPPRPKTLDFEQVPSPAKKPGQELSEGAIYKRMKRVFTPRADGSYIVPKEFVEKWKDLKTRTEVELLFEKCDYCTDPGLIFHLFLFCSKPQLTIS